MRGYAAPQQFSSILSVTLGLAPSYTFEDIKAMDISNNNNQPWITSSNKMVRSFTESLDERSVLAVGTKEAQEEIDLKIERRARFRRERVLGDLDNSSE